MKLGCFITGAALIAMLFPAQSFAESGNTNLDIGQGSGEKTSKTKIKVDIEAEIESSDNVFRLTESQKTVLEERNHEDVESGRYDDMEDVSDVTFSPRLKLIMDLNSPFGGDLDLTSSVTYHLHEENSAKDYPELQAGLKQEVGKSGEISLKLSYLNNFFRKNYLSEINDANGNGNISKEERIYSAAVYNELASALAYDYNLLKEKGDWISRIDIESFGGRRNRAYNSKFSNRNKRIMFGGLGFRIDGLKSDNEDESTKGYIYIMDGAFNITSLGDAIQAVTDVVVSAGDITLSSGGSSTSGKGIKAGVALSIDDGTFAINSTDDALHSNTGLTISGGSYSVSSGDDAFHADTSLKIDGGAINVLSSYEGIESENIAINEGTISIVSSDDGINGAGGVDSSGGDDGWHPPGGGAIGAYCLSIGGGHIAVYSEGDGIDVNGYITMTGGVALVHGPTSEENGALDFDSAFTISGGILVAAGSSRMAQTPSATSTQKSVNLITSQGANVVLHIQTTAGDGMLTFRPAKDYESIVFSSPELVSGSYDVYYGGTSTGAVVDGLFENGVFTPDSSSPDDHFSLN